uniref:DUF4007 family protein n=1 Tax=Dictyoglomus thermophilum TaxID=14 RepID=A0A7C3RME7_DICTH
MNNFIKINGYKYYTFGLRQEWLYSFLTNGENFLKENTLGPKQIEAFIYLLRDCELIDKNKNLTSLFHLLKSIYFKDGPYSQILWGIIWINLCFNVPIFTWWTTLPIRIYQRKDLISKLILSYGKENRYIKNGFCTLKETLSKSPIGEILGQGIPIKKGKIIQGFNKIGLKSLHPIVILYNLYKYAERENLYEIDLYSLENKLYSPQKIFSISTKDLQKSLLDESQYYNLYRLSLDRPGLIILYDFLKAINILEKYVGGEKQ